MQPVVTPAEVKARIGAVAPGDEVLIKVLSNKRISSKRVTVGELVEQD